MEQITSPDWLARMSLPANLETMKVALAVRRDALELGRLRDLEAHDHGELMDIRLLVAFVLAWQVLLV
jgi:hypothetical protein